MHVAKKGVLPQTQNVRGSNYVQIGVFADRIKNRAIVISVLDNLVKGSAGQAIQNMNLMLGFPETTGPGADRAVSVRFVPRTPAQRRERCAAPGVHVIV